MPALGLYTSLGFVPEKRLHRFYLNGKDAFRLVLPLCGIAKRDASSTMPVPDDDNKRRPLPVLLPPPHGSEDSDSDGMGMEPPAPGSPSSSTTGDDDDEYPAAAGAEAEEEGDPAKFVRLRRRVAALRACRMITVWPAEDDDRVSGR